MFSIPTGNTLSCELIIEKANLKEWVDFFINICFLLSKLV